MAKLGLLGALGGLGQGLTQIGKSMEQRRQEALENARALAKEQRDQAFRSQENQLTREAQDSRAAASIAAQNKRTTDTLAARSTEKVEDRKFRAGESAKTRANQASLVKLRGQIERDNSAAGKRLEKQLSAGDVHAVQYGAPDANGYAEVIVITKEGRTRATGQKVYRPPRVGDKDEDEGL